jgi:hypothetical protein
VGESQGDQLELLEDGEENIEDSMMETSEKDFVQNRKDKNLTDLEEKKNKLLFEE